MEEFFSESLTLRRNGPLPHRRSTSGVSGISHEDTRLELQRVDTGVTSIVGSDNGDRPGGFVLVIEGSALGNVSWYIHLKVEI